MAEQDATGTQAEQDRHTADGPWPLSQAAVEAAAVAQNRLDLAAGRSKPWWELGYDTRAVRLENATAVLRAALPPGPPSDAQLTAGQETYEAGPERYLGNEELERAVLAMVRVEE